MLLNALLLNESYANGGNAIPFQMFLVWRGTNWQNEFYSVPIINHDISFLVDLIKLPMR
jgi:hypothetical protein